MTYGHEMCPQNTQATISAPGVPQKFLRDFQHAEAPEPTFCLTPLSLGDQHAPYWKPDASSQLLPGLVPLSTFTTPWSPPGKPRPARADPVPPQGLSNLVLTDPFIQAQALGEP